MRKAGKRGKLAVWLAVVCALSLVAGLAACAPKSNESQGASQEVKQVETPEADEFGVVTASSWAIAYPDQCATYMLNEANSPDSGKHDYLELYPALNAMYKGYAFALGYDEASSHVYTLDSIKNTPRTIEKEQLANCITCKTPQFTAIINGGDKEFNKLKFNDVIDQFTEPISCYNCHENNPEQITVGNKFFLAALGADASDTDKAPLTAQACGQCHNEYYFNADTKEAANPYTSLATMTPEAILAYYDERGFKDWEHPDTGAAMIKAQHPEFETIYGGEKQTQMTMNGYTCADCHMGTVEGEDGEYTSHEWKSPLENDALIESNCSSCHADLKAQVAEWQAQEEERVIAISKKIETMIVKIAEGRANGTLEGDKLAELQGLHRTAQFFWDFVMVENSEGAHNPELTMDTLDLAEEAVDKALAMLG